MAPRVALFGASSVVACLAVRPTRFLGASRGSGAAAEPLRPGIGSRRSRHPVLGAVLALFAGLMTAVAAAPLRAEAPDPALLKRGEYLLRAGDCVACHTAPGGKPLAGGLIIDTPFGSLSTPNITPDKATGIGNWSDDQFYRAMHEGIDDKGTYLYPVFPFPWYTKVTREDVLAIKAYLFSVPPENAPRKPYQLRFPYNVRESLLAWRTAFFKVGTFAPDPAKSPELNRGAYLVEGLGHCGECHNHNGVFGASDWSGKLEGGDIPGWYAPNITSDGKEGIGSWSDADLVTFLKSGAAPGHGVALGPMKEAINNSLMYLSDEDLHAITAYLKSVSGKETYKPLDTAQQQNVSAAGAPTYLSFCASCHGVGGQGIPGQIPALAGNGSVTAQGPQNVVRVVLGGLVASNGLSPMPAVGSGMSDQQIADAVNYARTAWGNAAPGNAEPGLVAKLRAGIDSPLSVASADRCQGPAKNPALKKAVEESGLRESLANVTLGNMLQPIDAILSKVKAQAPAAKDDDIVNALTQAYCPLAMADPNAAGPDRTARLGAFSVLVYGQLKRGEGGTVKN